MKINTEVELFFSNQNISQIITNPKKWFTTVSLILFTSVTFVCTMKRGKKKNLGASSPRPPSLPMFFWPLNFQAHHHQLKRLCPPASWTSADRRCRRRASSWRWWWGGPACGGGWPSAPGLSAGRGQREGMGGASYYQLLSAFNKVQLHQFLDFLFHLATAWQNYNKGDGVFSPLFEATCLKSWCFVEQSDV